MTECDSMDSAVPKSHSVCITVILLHTRKRMLNSMQPMQLLSWIFRHEVATSIPPESGRLQIMARVNIWNIVAIGIIYWIPHGSGYSSAKFIDNKLPASELFPQIARSAVLEFEIQTESFRLKLSMEWYWFSNSFRFETALHWNFSDGKLFLMNIFGSQFLWVGSLQMLCPFSKQCSRSLRLVDNINNEFCVIHPIVCKFRNHDDSLFLCTFSGKVFLQL